MSDHHQIADIPPDGSPELTSSPDAQSQDSSAH